MTTHAEQHPAPEDKPESAGMIWAEAVLYAERLGIKLPPAAQIALYKSIHDMLLFRERPLDEKGGRDG